MLLNRRAEPFNHPDWLFEIKWEGFRSLAYIENGRCRLVSRNGNDSNPFQTLNCTLPLEWARSSAWIGKAIPTQFKNQLFRRGEPRFYAFDLLSCNGEDLRYLPLSERKHKLRGAIAQQGKHLLYCDHVEGQGERLFQLACKRDLEGIVAKRSSTRTCWMEVQSGSRNTKYSQ